MTGHKFIRIRRAALCLLLSTTAHANEAVTVGAGNVSCGTFLTAMNAMSPAPSGEVRTITYETKTWYEEGTQYMQWIWGYVSGYNVTQPMKRQIKVDNIGIMQWVKHYCGNNEDVTLLYATGAFIVHEKKNRLDASASRPRLILPKPLKPMGTQFCISHRVRNVPVPEVLLNRSSVVSLVRELVASGVPEHVRMDREGEFRELAGARNELARRRRRHRSAALGDEQVGRFRVVAAELAQRPEFGPADRVSRVKAVLQSRDVHQAGLEVNLLPAHCHELRHPQPMPVGQEDERPIARTVAAHFG
jgi:hypothetical protein